MANPSIYQAYLQQVRSVGDYAMDMDKRDATALELLSRRQQMAQAAEQRNALQAAFASTQDPVQLEGKLMTNPATLAQGMDMRKARTAAEEAAAKAKNYGSEITSRDDKNAREAADAERQKRVRAIADIASFKSPQDAIDSVIRHAKAGEVDNATAQRMVQQFRSMTTPEHWAQWQDQAITSAMAPADIMTHRRQLTNDAAQNANRDLIQGPGGQFAPNAPLIDAKKQSAAASVAPQMAYSVHTNPLTGDAMAIPNKGAPGQPLNAIPINVGGKPLKGPDPNKPTADYMKQAEAYRNMDDALTNYTQVLNGFSNADMLVPSRRAAVATAYNNAMLQGKEIYKLGVLNGGDERILNGILANPVSFTGAMLPVASMQKQAKDLQGIIARGNENLAAVNKQQRVPLKSEAGTAVPDDIQALLKKHGGR